MRVGPPSTGAQCHEQHDQEKDSAPADTRVILLKKGIEAGKRFIARRVAR
jgi:hypothetical protein